MTNNKEIVEKLSLFNNLSFTKKQWDIILKGCRCPKYSYLWSALRQTNLIKDSKLYTLVDMNINSFNKIQELCSKMNKECINKCRAKKKARKKYEENLTLANGITFYMIGGVLTTEIPNREL